jgi:hypothetical protein
MGTQTNEQCFELIAQTPESLSPSTGTPSSADSSPGATDSLAAINDILAQFPVSLPYELPVTLTVVGALYLNGRILGMPTCTMVAGKSSPAGPSVPPPLRPTEVQLYTVHLSGIDRFPFPKFRDNMIIMSALVDEEEFTQDLCLLPSFTIRSGGAPWDPRAWSIEKPFARKWGFLFS